MSSTDYGMNDKIKHNNDPIYLDWEGTEYGMYGGNVMYARWINEDEEGLTKHHEIAVYEAIEDCPGFPQNWIDNPIPIWDYIELEKLDEFINSGKSGKRFVDKFDEWSYFRLVEKAKKQAYEQGVSPERLVFPHNLDCWKGFGHTEHF